MLAFSLCEMDELAEAVMNRLFDGIDARADEVFGGPRYMTAWKRFSVSDHLAATALDDWVPDKEKGNACFEAKDYARARAHYERGATLARSPTKNGATKAFQRALAAWPAASAARRFAECKDLYQLVLQFLLAPTHDRTMTLGDARVKTRAPNQGLAICCANRSAAWLLDGNFEEALTDARRATDADPGYVKGHRRERAALVKLSRVAEAREKDEELQIYDRAKDAYPAESLALIAAGWLSFERASFIYGPLRFDACLEELRAGGGFRECEARPSLVPFQGGQCLMLSLCYGWPRDFCVQCVDWVLVDAEHADLAEQPPNGTASAMALAHAPTRIANFVHEVDAYGFDVVAVMLGQGLTDHVDLVDRRIREGSDDMDVPPKAGVLVYHASSTAASEDSGIPPNPDPRQDAARELRRPRPPPAQEVD